MKKLCLKLLLLILLLQLVTMPVSAGDSGWQFGEAGSFEDIHIAQMRDTAAYSGLKSLYMDCYESQRNEANYIEVKNVLTKTPEAGEYILKFYVKPGQYGQWTGTFDVSFGSETYMVDAGAGTKVTAPSGEKGWTEHILNFSYDGNGDGTLYIRAYNSLYEVHLDNFHLSLSGSEENLVSNSSFEDGVSVDTPGASDAYDRTGYIPKNLLISAGSGILGINWKNPSVSPDKISLYDITSGEEVFVTDEFSKTSGETVIYKKTGLLSGSVYKYKLVFDFGSKGKDSYYLVGTPSGDNGPIYKNLELRHSISGAAGYCPGELIIDKTVGYNSTSSLKFVSNIDRDLTEMQGNIYLKFNLVMDEIQAGGRYEVSYKYKTDNLKRDFQAHMNWKNFDGEGSTVKSTGTTSDWVSKKHMYTYNGTNALSFIIDGECNSVWFDDIECYEVDENGVRTTGINIAVNGDFETEGLSVTGAISEVSVEAGMNSAVVSWVNPGENYIGAHLYQKVFDNFEYRGFITGLEDNMKFSDLNYGKEYTYKIVPVNDFGVEGEEHQVTFTTDFPEYDISDLLIKKDGNKVDGFSGKGMYTIAVNVKNYLIPEEIECELIVIIFNENDEMEGIYSARKSLPMTDANISPSNIYVNFEVPDDGNYTAEVYLINNRNEMELFRNPEKY